MNWYIVSTVNGQKLPILNSINVFQSELIWHNSIESERIIIVQYILSSYSMSLKYNVIHYMNA